MTDIVQFINDRLAEDQAVAEAEGGSEWETSGPGYPEAPEVRITDERGRFVAETNGTFSAEHAARHDPARVLREVKAKRAIVEWHAVRRTARDARDPEEQATVDICWCGYDQPCATIRHVAAVYADHPDYSPAWRVE